MASDPQAKSDETSTDQAYSLPHLDLDTLIENVVEHYMPETSEIGWQIGYDVARRWWCRHDRDARAELAQTFGFAFDDRVDAPPIDYFPDDLEALTDALGEIEMHDRLYQTRLAQAEEKAKQRFEKQLKAERAALREEFEDDLAEARERSGHVPASSRSRQRTTARYLLDPSAVEQLPENGRRVKKHAGLAVICSQRLPFVECRDRGLFGRVREALLAKYPHAEAVIEGLLRPLDRNFLAGRAALKMRPTILVGSPGCGKTALLRDFAAALGLPSTQLSVAGNGDSNLLGVSAGWGTAMPSIMTSSIAGCRMINPLIVLDEIDKAQTTINGSVQESLLPLLEHTEAGQYHERFLASAVDASHVNWACTANSLDRVTGPLLSRCDVFEMPIPDQHHVRPIARSIVTEHARGLGLDPRFYNLSEGDLDYLEQTYPRHRSVRVLAELVRRLLDASEPEHFNA